MTESPITERSHQEASRLANYEGPGLAIHHVEVEGPIVREFPSRGHQLLFQELARVEVEPRNPAEKQKSWYKPKFDIRSSNPPADTTATLARIARLAFRRPVSADEVTPYVDLFERELAGQASIEDALRTAVSAILCAPDFLFLREDSGALNDHALASRLAYFLTRTTPDEALREEASAGTLASDPSRLRSHTERLLNDPRLERFLADFTDAWLNLREIDFTAPDRQLFPEFDQFLKPLDCR